MILTAVDPGLRGCGVALFDNGRLIKASYVESGFEPAEDVMKCAAVMALAVDRFRGPALRGIDILAVERPIVYASRIRRGETKADPNDLLGLAAVDGALSVIWREVKSYTPAEWKGQMKKEACRARIGTRLTGAERTIADAASRAAGTKAHNMWDAIGIGLFHLGRFDRKRVIP